MSYINVNRDQFDQMDSLCAVDLDDMDFVKVIRQRRNKGIIKDSFDEDVTMWQEEIIPSLPPLDAAAIRKEVESWDLSIPREEYDLNILQGVYSSLTAHHYRVVELLNIANAHYKTFSKAYKSLKTIAMAMYSGTAKDKEAYAENEVLIFLKYLNRSEIVYDYLYDVNESISFAATNMSRILREREAQAKFNTNYQSEGNAYKFSRLQKDDYDETEDISRIHTRRRRNL